MESLCLVKVARKKLFLQIQEFEYVIRTVGQNRRVLALFDFFLDAANSNKKTISENFLVKFLEKSQNLASFDVFVYLKRSD